MKRQIRILTRDNIYCLFFCLFIVPVVLPLSHARADWGDILDFLPGNPAKGLTNTEVIRGLKEALGKGTRTAINELGRHDGYFRNNKVRIPMPEKIQKAEDILRSLNQDELVDEFILSMNRAAEQAVPAAADIFASAIGEMTFEDARAILDGPDDAATRYFRRTSGKELGEKMLPLVRQSTSNVGVTARYKQLTDKLGIAASLIDTDSIDLDRYVTKKAIDGLFRLLADQEQLIRKDPAARTTDLLKKVFGK